MTIWEEHPGPVGVGEFARLPLGEVVDEWRRRMAGLQYGVVVDEQGKALTCVHSADLADSDGVLHAPDLPPSVLVRADARPISAVALQAAREQVWDSRFGGVVLVDPAGRPVDVLSRRMLLDRIDGRRWPTDSSGMGPAGSMNADSIQTRGPLTLQERATRYGDVDFPAFAQLGEKCRLVVTVRQRPTLGSIELTLPPGEWPLRLTVTLLAVDPADFEVLGPSIGVVEVPEDGDSPELVFILRPRRLGTKVLRVRFEHGNEWLSVARTETEVTERVPVRRPAAVESAPAITHRSLAPDVTIYITAVGHLRYDIEVRTHDDAPGTPARLVDRLEFRESPRDFVAGLFAEFEDAAGSSELDDLASRLGTALYERLFQSGPRDGELPGFDAFYWAEMRPRSEEADLARRWRSVQVVSDDPYLPWEVLRPTRRLPDGSWQDDLPFCLRFDLVRWLSEAHSVGTAALRRVALVAPPSDLRWVEEEVSGLRDMAEQLLLLTDRQAVRRLLKNGPAADVIHFACHGRLGELGAARAAIWIGGDRFSPLDITGQYRNFGRHHPLIFVNACDTARSGMGITGLEGWAQAFLSAGAGVFVGSLWAANDEAACRFALAFYHCLRVGGTIGEAARAGRLAAAVVAGEVAHLGFVVFGNPCVRVNLSPSEPVSE